MVIGHGTAASGCQCNIGAIHPRMRRDGAPGQCRIMRRRAVKHSVARYIPVSEPATIKIGTRNAVSTHLSWIGTQVEVHQFRQRIE